MTNLPSPTPPRVRFDAGRVRGYYERNTAAFVAWGQGGSFGAIHRAVWAPGVATREQAFRYVEDRVAALVDAAAADGRVPHVLDLGCGVGASLAWLAARRPMRGTGITISPAQAALAGEHLRAAGLDDRIACIEGDYCRLPPGLAPVDVAFAIEAFVHGPDPARFFTEAAAVIRPGGHLIVCDDVRRTGDGQHLRRGRGRAEAAIDRFCRGWHVNTLIDREAMAALAADAGFAHASTTDLTPWLELGRPRDRALAVLEALAAPVLRLGWHAPRLDALVGGSALRRCLANGWVGYELTVFRRP